jgi:hypothetical protein
MNNRRTFLKTGALIGSGIYWNDLVYADQKSARHALLFGIEKYRNIPELTNPKNDAESFGKLLADAGWQVSTEIDATKSQMENTLEGFETLVGASPSNIAIIYFAGHGVQLNWRNYLVPIDAEATSSEALQRTCIDLNAVLERLSLRQATSFIFIVDACRDDPFKKVYTPLRKGLAQFDAPPNCLIAYSTSPGGVASDGEGNNGLYTQYLLQEFSARETRIFDALKRVRLEVRLVSKGQQIPWETTALDIDYSVSGSVKIDDSESSLQRELKAEVELWRRVRSSLLTEDMLNYLRVYPNGRYCEIAETRLNRILAGELGPGKSEKYADQLGDAFAGTVDVSINPFSAGRFKMGRQFSMDDVAAYKVTDIDGREKNPYTMLVTDIDVDVDRVILNGGDEILDSMGNYLLAHESRDAAPRWKNEGGGADMPRQMVPSEIYVGRAWTAYWTQNNRRKDQLPLAFYVKVRVTAFEKLRVPAGEFNAFRIEANGIQDDLTETGNSYTRVARKHTVWVVPGMNFSVKDELILKRYGSAFFSERRELTLFRQKNMPLLG